MRARAQNARAAGVPAEEIRDRAGRLCLALVRRNQRPGRFVPLIKTQGAPHTLVDLKLAKSRCGGRPIYRPSLRRD